MRTLILAALLAAPLCAQNTIWTNPAEDASGYHGGLVDSGLKAAGGQLYGPPTAPWQMSGLAQSAADACTNAGGNPSLYLDSTSLAFTAINASCVIASIQIVPAASRTANQFATYVDSSGVQHYAAIAQADLPVFTGDSGSGGAKGAVPAPASGDAAAGKFLKADATWAVPSGGGGSSGWPVGSTPSLSPATGTYTSTQGATASCSHGTAYYCLGTLGSACASSAAVTAYSTAVSVATSARFQAQCRDGGYDPGVIGYSDITISGHANGYSLGATFTFNVHPGSSLTAFPNLVSGTYAALADTSHGGYVTHTTTLNGQTVPADLIFTSDSAGSTPLSWEVESWNNTTGAIVAWVKSDRSSSADTLIYAWVGKSSVTTYQCTASATWDSNYKGVWHFPNGVTLSTVDSTATGNSATSTMAAGAGQIDGAAIASFNDHTGVNFGGNAAINVTGPFSVQLWLNESQQLFDNNNLFGNFAYSGSVYEGWTLITHPNTNPATVFTVSAELGGSLPTVNGSAALSVGTAYHKVDLVLDSSLLRLYTDGNPDGTVAASSTPASTLNTVFGGAGYNYFGGGLDEVRISNIARSADWIAHEYRQQSGGSAWYTVGGWL